MDSTSPNGAPDDKSSNGGAPEQRNKSYWKKAEIVAVFGIIEVIALVLWQKADEFSSFSGELIHWLSECGFLAGGAYLIYKFTKKHLLVWGIFIVVCIGLFVTIPKREEQHLTLVLESNNPLSGAHNTLELTNDFLFKEVNEQSTNINGVLFIPVIPGDTNRTLTFSLKNKSTKWCDSPIIFLQYPLDLSLSAKGWKLSPPLTGRMNGLMWDERIRMRPASDDLRPLPQVILPPSSMYWTSDLIFSINADGFSHDMCCFNVFFGESTNLVPRVLHGTLTIYGTNPPRVGLMLPKE